MTRENWTEAEDKLVEQTLNKNPNNLQEAFRALAISLGRTKTSVEGHWYQNLRKKNQRIFSVNGKKGKRILTNGKNQDSLDGVSIDSGVLITMSQPDLAKIANRKVNQKSKEELINLIQE